MVFQGISDETPTRGHELRPQQETETSLEADQEHMFYVQTLLFIDHCKCAGCTIVILAS